MNTIPAFFLCAAAALAQQAGQQQPPKIDESRLLFHERQELAVHDFDAPGYILDIGGGGEGVIGQLKPKQVIAIDPSERELKEAPAGPLKIVMDARELKFLDASFGAATSFFTLMYIKATEHERVFREVHRVLMPGGRFRVWDVNVPAKGNLDKDIAVYRFLFKLPGKEITTGYGTPLNERVRDLAHYVKAAEAAGFRVAEKREEGNTFYLELEKQ